MSTKPQAMLRKQKQIDWGPLFFSTQGRTGVFSFLIAASILFVAVAFYLSTVNGVLHISTGIVVYPAIFYCASRVLSKRLHDRGRSGWWSAVILLAMVMVWPKPSDSLDLLALLVLGWALIDLGFMPGERGVNRYGSNPLYGPESPQS